MAATRTVRTTSQMTITERRGRRSATSARNRPPITHGTYPDAYTTAVRNGDLGVLKDEQGEGHQGEPVARDRQDLGEPQGPELADREHVAERGTRRHGTLSR